MTYEVTSPTIREHFSFSQLVTAAKCGEMYRRQYISGDPQDQWNVPALVGTAFHAAVEGWECDNRTVLAEAPSLIGQSHVHDLVIRTKDIVRETMVNEQIDPETIRHYGKQDLPFWFRSKIPTIAKQYVERRAYEHQNLGFQWAMPGEPSNSMEVKCQVLLGGHPFLGYIDQVFLDSEGRVVIRDVKSGAQHPEHAMQLEMYRVALKEQHGVEAAYGQILYVAAKGEAAAKVVKWSLSDGEVINAVARLAYAVEHGVLLINGPFTGSCENCGFTDCGYRAVTVRGIA